jgi:hypothetical protein
MSSDATLAKMDYTYWLTQQVFHSQLGSMEIYLDRSNSCTQKLSVFVFQIAAALIMLMSTILRPVIAHFVELIVSLATHGLVVKCAELKSSKSDGSMHRQVCPL